MGRSSLNNPGQLFPAAQFGAVSAGNYAEFLSDGTLRFYGDGTDWDDQQINLSSVRLPASGAPTWTAYKGSFVLAFAGNADNTIHFAAQLAHGYEVGTDLEFHIHYVPEDDTAGNVRWVFTHSIAAIGAAFPGETTVTTLLATPEVADKHTLGEIAAAIGGSGAGISTVILCSLMREATNIGDTYNGKDIYVTALDFHIKKNSLGSRQEVVK